MKKNTTVKNNKSIDANSVVAKSTDGTIQITLSIPFKTINSARDEVIEKLSKNIQVPGFRKGKAPLNKIIEQIPEHKLLEETLNTVLPKSYIDALEKHKIKPAIYPKFELVKSEEGKDWQVRAITCEIPEIDLGNYKELIRSQKESTIWTPDKDKKDSDNSKVESRQEKEQKIINTISNLNIKIPKLIIDREVESRLANLLERIEKLGLTLDSYLSSIGKTAEILRSEYEEQARKSVLIEIALEEIAKKEGIEVSKKEIDNAIEAASPDVSSRKKLDTPEQRRVIESVLRRRTALDSLVSLL